ncbi:MAG: hypothetical protein IKR83_03545 [Bacteroidales bacterium]|nr:hypothetical protein [Bacteroidales bacterium]
MKTNRILWFLTVAMFLTAIASFLYALNPWNIRGVETSELYQQYANTDGIEAAFIHNYKVNDTLSIDITLLQATDSAGWDLMCSSFNCQPKGVNMDNLKKGIDVMALLTGTAKREHGLTDSEVAVVSFLGEYICIFHNLDSIYRNKLIDAITDKIFNDLKHNQKFIENEKDS